MSWTMLFVCLVFAAALVRLQRKVDEIHDMVSEMHQPRCEGVEWMPQTEVPKPAVKKPRKVQKRSVLASLRRKLNNFDAFR